jgi:hypothetical protein
METSEQIFKQAVLILKNPNFIALPIQLRILGDIIAEKMFK